MPATPPVKRRFCSLQLELDTPHSPIELIQQWQQPEQLVKKSKCFHRKGTRSQSDNFHHCLQKQTFFMDDHLPVTFSGAMHQLLSLPSMRINRFSGTDELVPVLLENVHVRSIFRQSCRNRMVHRELCFCLFEIMPKQLRKNT